MQRSLLAVCCLAVVALALCPSSVSAQAAASPRAAVESPAVSSPALPAVAPQNPQFMTWFCTPPPNLPKHAFYTCGSNSPATYCRGKALDTVCGVSGGYCLYCWQYPGGVADDFGNLPCNCRNNQ